MGILTGRSRLSTGAVLRRRGWLIRPNPNLKTDSRHRNLFNDPGRRGLQQ
jgi:hypothetical protein